METEVFNKTSGRKVVLITLIIIISAALIYYAIMSMRSPALALEKIKNESGIKNEAKNSVDNGVDRDSVYLSMFREKAYLQSRTVMAETDSIYLTVNLLDSTANLEISGVSVHKAKISGFRISNCLMKGDQYSVLTMLSSPFTIANSVSTIKKDPVMIKMAPKDTSEYKPDIMPDTSIVQPVNFKLDMTNGVRIYVYQDEKEKPADRKSFRSFDINDRLKDSWYSIKSVAHFKVPEYHPFIKLQFSQSDAKIIYRALPRNGQIAVYW